MHADAPAGGDKFAAERGWSVAINYRADEAMAKQTIDDVQKIGGKAIGCQGDVSDERSVIEMFKEAKRVFGQIEVVVINAGIVAPSQPLADITLDRMERILRVNVLGAMLCAREAARYLPRPQEASAASIVLVSSAAARPGTAREVAEAIIWLSGDEAAYTTGAILDIAGGR